MQDPLWMRAFLAVHITAGSGAFVLAPLALMTAKGGKAHRLWGKIYFWCMTVVAATAMVMSPVQADPVSSSGGGIQLLCGIRCLSGAGTESPHGRANRSQGPWTGVAAVICFTASAALALLGALKPVLVQNLAIPAIVFGAIGMRIAGKAMWNFTHHPKAKMFWWYAHLQGMIGSYIAAWTAFCVVTIGPRVHGAWWLWVLPTAIGVPAIIATTAYYKSKFTSKPKVVVA